jgi:hypothetical protein
MGNVESSPDQVKANYKQRSFPGSAIVDKLVEPCGSLQNTHDDNGDGIDTPKGVKKFLQHELCAHSPTSMDGDEAEFDDEYEDFRREQNDGSHHHATTATGGTNASKKQSYSPSNPTSELLARALVMEVTDNPKTMTPAAMAEREYRLLKAQEKAKQAAKAKPQGSVAPRPVGAPGGVGNPSILGTISHALTGSADTVQNRAKAIQASVLPPSLISENRAQVEAEDDQNLGKYTVTIGLCLSRRSNVGHPDTVTRQTAFDFNELQDREYKFVSSTDASGWRAGGGERGGASPLSPASDHSQESDRAKGVAAGTPTANGLKLAAPDTVHIPIIHIDAESPQQIDEIIAALARGEIFIPHMAITPESLSVNGVSPPDLVVRFGTERNDDIPPEEWQNWCLEFMHNQLYEYFYDSGARWMKRPFSITLAKKVRWKTVKHMNKYFSHAEKVIDAWRERGPQTLDPQLAYIEGGATPEEVSKPHGIYLFREGVPTNYFAPNFAPPYTTKMTRNLLLNVLGKSWDKKRREWTMQPVPRLITPSMLVTAMCGCSDSNAGGFLANEVTLKGGIDTSSIPMDKIIRSDEPIPNVFKQQSKPPSQRRVPPTPAGTDAADTDIFSEAAQTPVHHMDGSIANDSAVFPTDSFHKLNISSSTHDDDTLSALRYNGTPAETPASHMSEAADRFVIPDDVPAYDPTLDISIDTGVNSSAVQPSVTNSNSTIMHTNISAEQFMKRELNRHLAREEKKEENLASDDDWLDSMVSSILDAPGAAAHQGIRSHTIAILRQGKPLGTPVASERTEKDMVKAALEKERARQLVLMAKAKDHTSSNQEKKPQSEMMKAAAAKKTINDASGTIYKNNSGVSLDYSMDSHTVPGDGSSALSGGKFAADASVNSSSTKGTVPSQKLRLKQDPLAMSPAMSTPREDDESAFSIQESTSSVEVVPSDEDLFAVGWAKALDPKSGSFYYFTLDRSQIVWDNPLQTRMDDETEASSLPDGSVVI